MLSVCANVSKEVYDYYFGCDLDSVVNALLDTFEFDNLPQMSGKREVELRITVQNELYEKMYNIYGPRSKKVSIGRLLEFGYNMDILKSEKFKIYKVEANTIPAELVCLRRALRGLSDAKKYDDSQTIKVLYDALKAYIVQTEAKDVQSSNL